MIVSMHRAGIGYRGIVAELNARGIPTPGGRHRWYPSHVSRLLNTANVVEQFGRPRTARRSNPRAILHGAQETARGAERLLGTTGRFSG
ncbi:recombinase family protein [Nocardia gipuzkoensis]